MMNYCRTCLSTRSLSPIFAIADKSEEYTNILFNVTGMTIIYKDSLSQSMCTTCINFVNQCLEFRQKCLATYKDLINLTNDKRKEIIQTLKPVENTCPVSNNSSDCDVNDDFDDVSDFNNSVSNDARSNDYIEIEMTVEEVLKKPLKIIIDNMQSKKSLDNMQVKKIQTVKCKKEIDENGECKYCHKIMKKSSLNKHYHIHIGFDVVCEHCGKKFANKSHLLRHCKSKHGYEKTDKCSYCDYRGSSIENVKIHERLHTGERPYVCPQCGAGFHRRSSYLQHVPIHLPDKTVQCDQCPALFKSVTLMRIHKQRHKKPRTKKKNKKG